VLSAHRKSNGNQRTLRKGVLHVWEKKGQVLKGGAVEVIDQGSKGPVPGGRMDRINWEKSQGKKGG